MDQSADPYETFKLLLFGRLERIVFEMRNDVLDQIRHAPYFKLIILIVARKPYSATVEEPLQRVDNLFIPLMLTDGKTGSNLDTEVHFFP